MPSNEQMAVAMQKISKAHLIGRKIVKVVYVGEPEAKTLGWEQRPVMLILDDGTAINPLSDTEGNEGGCLEIVFKNGYGLKLPAIGE